MAESAAADDASKPSYMKQTKSSRVKLRNEDVNVAATSAVKKNNFMKSVTTKLLDLDKRNSAGPAGGGNNSQGASFVSQSSRTPKKKKPADEEDWFEFHRLPAAEESQQSLLWQENVNNMLQ